MLRFVFCKKAGQKSRECGGHLFKEGLKIMMVWGLILRPSPIFSHRSAAGSPLRKGGVGGKRQLGIE